MSKIVKMFAGQLLGDVECTRVYNVKLDLLREVGNRLLLQLA